MRILVLGGSYFLGKAFVKAAAGIHDITVFNRGTRPLDIDIKQIRGDRHIVSDLQQLSNHSFDVVVDFCAYQQGDIVSVLEALNFHVSQYIYVSTVDVYTHGLGTIVNEEGPFENRTILGQEGAYISGKVALEHELVDTLQDKNMVYTIFRPSFIYGPDNYAPREGIYFHWIKQAGQILHPTDATGEFQFVYVDDAARAILNACGNSKADNQAFNLASDEIVTYDIFADCMRKSIDAEFSLVPITLEGVYNNNIPLPFPLTKEESNWYDGTKVLSLIERYTPLHDGIKLLWQYEN